MYKTVVENKMNKLNEKISEITEELCYLNIQDNFIDRINPRNKKLKESYIRYLEKKLTELYSEKQKIDVLDKSQNLIDLDVNLDSSDYAFFKESNDKKKIEKIEDIIMIHKTNFLPINGVLYSPKLTGAKQKISFLLDGKEHSYEHYACNDTLHFTLNGPVVDHLYGSWSNRKYAVIIPFSSVDHDNLLSFNPEDTYFKDKVVLPSDSIILCPDIEKEKVKKENPNIKVIGYDNSISLDQAIKCVLLYKGYNVKIIDNHGWFSNDETDMNSFKSIKENLGYVDKEGPHYYSDNLSNARTKRFSEKIVLFAKYLIDNNLEEYATTEQGLTEIANIINMNMLPNYWGGKDFKLEDYNYFFNSVLTAIIREKIYIIPEKFKETIEFFLHYSPKKVFDSEIFCFFGFHIITELIYYSALKKGIYEKFMANLSSEAIKK